ncbi:sensor histidine kinase [Paenibacillus agaridevorans]|uniref:Sensor histidine kinase n=1 Tax=Paenibacillus agaridevorans TaxID=171404 RepID=A0A2R5EGP8_9BACL|nr:histidine kinase [Paenibacillus agaridevorans]GBG05740.1 sensor histidine kinase [Paenibacillus agaridevorans]
MFIKQKTTLSVFMKLFLSFSAIIIALYFLYWMMNNAASKTIQTEIEQSLQSRVHFYHNSLETDIKRVIQLKNEYLHDNDLAKISFSREQMSDYEFAEAILRIKNRLLLLKTSSLYVEDVQVYIPLINRTISPEGYVANPTETEITQLRKSNLTAPLVNWQNKLLIVGFSPELISKDIEPIIVFKVQLSIPNIRSSLKQIDTTNKGGMIFIDHAHQWAIYGHNTPSEIEQALYAYYQNNEALLKTGTFYHQINDERYVVIAENSSLLNSTSLIYFPESDILKPLQNSKTWIWWISIASILILFGFSIWTYRLIQRPLLSLVLAFRKVEHGDLTVSIKRRRSDEFSYLYDRFNAMVSELNVLVKEVYEQKIRSQRAELKQLQSQINPHFLYNSYFVVHRLAKIPDIDNVVRISRHLGEYFRYITKNDRDAVTLKEELAHTLAYIQIQMYRFDQRIHTICEEIPDYCRDIYVPKLFLQPIIENAYEHGLKNTLQNGLVEISFKLADKDLYICVTDNGQELSSEQLQILQDKLSHPNDLADTTGMLNVHRRLQLIYGQQYGITLSRTEIGGLNVTLKLNTNPKTE